MTIQPKQTALIIVDVQIGMFHESNPVFAGAMLLENIRLLINHARSRNIHVIYTQYNAPSGKLLEPNTSNWAIHPSVIPMESELIVQKYTPDPFYQTNFKAELESRGIGELVVAGIQSEACVDTTCRRAFGEGFKVILAKDAHSTMNSTQLTALQIIEHHNHVLRWFAMVIETSEIISLK